MVHCGHFANPYFLTVLYSHTKHECYMTLRATNSLEGCRCGVNHPELICRLAKHTVFGAMTLRSEPTGISALEGRGK
jgi:hypothetical protein